VDSIADQSIAQKGRGRYVEIKVVCGEFWGSGAKRDSFQDENTTNSDQIQQNHN
jgi:hypothetical protein